MRIAPLLSMLRIHQWTKNLLILVPVITSFKLTDTEGLRGVAGAFFAFSLLASATYIGNDLLDLESDRAHPRKRTRALASGDVSLPTGMVVAILLGATSLILAWHVSPAVLLMLLAYLCLTATYSFAIKGYFLLDVILLALLYTWRILVGSVAVGVSTSEWLLAFSCFFFLSLALVKRCTEVRMLGVDNEKPMSKRDYRASDHAVLQSIGISSCMSAVVVFCLFINSPETMEHYATPEALWLVACAILYWCARLWVKTSRGEMHDDPVVYALKDRGSRILMLFIGIVMLIAHSVHFPNLLGI